MQHAPALPYTASSAGELLMVNQRGSVLAWCIFLKLSRVLGWDKGSRIVMRLGSAVRDIDEGWVALIAIGGC